MSNIIITGGSGFVGKCLFNFFCNKKEILVNISRFPKRGEISYKQMGMEVWNKSKFCIHLAGNNHHIKKVIKEIEYFEVNTELTKKLFDQFLESTCETFIYMSSVKAAADEVVGVLDESVIPAPATAYGKSKLAAEEYILNQKLAEGKRVYILRPCMIHGPGNKGNLNLLYNFVSKGIPYPFGAYQNQRSFLSVENLCFVIKELIENKGIPSGVYNIADDIPLSTKEVVIVIGEVVGKPSKILNTPKGLVNLITKVGDFLSLPINSERVQKLTENYCVSNAKIKRVIGKEFPLSAKEGLRKTIRSFGENL